MARTLATVQAEIDEIKGAIATGALRVRFNDRDVTYRTLTEMERVATALESELAVLGGAARTRSIQIIGVKGL